MMRRDMTLNRGNTVWFWIRIVQYQRVLFKLSYPCLGNVDPQEVLLMPRGKITTFLVFLWVSTANMRLYALVLDDSGAL